MTHAVGPPATPPAWHEVEIVIIGDRLRDLRQAKHLSQSDVEKRTGLLRCYVSRLENGHTVPAIETLEKMARALEIPMYQLFYDGDEPRELPLIGQADTGHLWGQTGAASRDLFKLRKALARMSPEGRALVMLLAQKVAKRNR